MSAKKLAGLSVLVTRPKPNGELLCQLIEEQGGKTFYLPTIEIISQKIPLSLHSYDWTIFTSPQAVYHSMGNILSPPARIAAIGQGTRDLLQTSGFKVDVYPKKNWNSEGLLALEEFQYLSKKKIAIVKGERGRELLFEKLTERGAKVTFFNVYKRILPSIDCVNYIDLLHQKAIDVVICTSNEGLENLKTLLHPAWDNLKNLTIVVISERMKLKAIELGFNKILLAKNASHQALLKALQ